MNRAIGFLLAAWTAVGLGCDLNPQPLPPMSSASGPEDASLGDSQGGGINSAADTGTASPAADSSPVDLRGDASGASTPDSTPPDAREAATDGGAAGDGGEAGDAEERDASVDALGE
jgi:hypothetical protein